MVAGAVSESFAAVVGRWQKKCGRHHLPWQAATDPYKIWLAEVMLQQTQVATVIPYYQKFVRRFPSVQKLARARSNSVLAVWSGLGYYARARNLHAAAKMICRSGFPVTAAQWQTLPGVGRSTAAAIAVFANDARAAILDGNVKRVLARVFAIESPINTAATDAALWQLAESLMPPQKRMRAYTQGLMDLGAIVCVRGRPHCGQCPLAAGCLAHQRQLTEVLPQRRAGKAKPLKKTAMALIYHDNHVLLERRPASGIWGGLWSLPEGQTAASLQSAWERQLGCALQLRHRGEFWHVFTHYRLHARVLAFAGAAASVSATAAWVAHRALDKTALPAPVRGYLQKIIGECRLL